MKKSSHAKSLRYVSVLLVVLMLVSSFPIAIFAEGTDNAEPVENNGLKVLLKMDYLSKDAATVGKEHITNDWAFYAKRGTGDEVLSNQKDGRTALVGVDTDLPLEKSSRYVITFSLKQSELANTNKIGSAFGLFPATHTGNAAVTGGIFASVSGLGNEFSVCSGYNRSPYTYAYTTGKKAVTPYTEGSGNLWDLAGDDGYVQFTMTVNCATMSVYCGDVLIGAYSIDGTTGSNAKYSDLKLMRLGGGTSHAINSGALKTGIEVGVLMANVKDITVYSAELPENTELLHMSDLSANRTVTAVPTVKTQLVPHAAGSGHNGNNSGAYGAISDGIYTNGGRSNYYSSYGAVGVDTNIPLSTTSQYSITYSMKKGQADTENGLWTYFGVVGAADYNGSNCFLYGGAHMAISPDGTKVGLHHINWVEGVYGKEGNNTDMGVTELDFSVWDRADADGYVSFMITLDGYIMSLFCNGEKVAAYDLEATGSADKSISYARTDRFNSVFLVAGFHDPATETATNWEMKGDALTYYQANQVKDLDKTVPMLYCKDISVYSGILSQSTDSEIVGWQDSLNEDGTRNVRVLGGIYDLVGDAVGFDVCITYKDANGETQQKTYRRQSGTVYTSILAEGERISATDKGVNYLFAVVIEGIPADIDLEQLQFTVTPFKLIRENERVYGETKTFSVQKGA